MIGEFETTYIPRKVAGNYTIATFGDSKRCVESKHPEGVYKVKQRNDGEYVCDCMGWMRQNNKSQHKHSRIIDFWKNKLEETPGYALWFEGEDIEFRKFLEWDLVQDITKTI